METMTDYSYIRSDDELRSSIQDLRDSKKFVVALDTEGENNRHAYGQRLCLVQVYDGTRLLLVDPLAMSDEALRLLFESRDILKVMYDASNDLSLLKRVHGIEIASILDLRPAVELLGYEKKDLQSVIAAEFGTVLTGKAIYQVRNWLTRPIADDAIQYALNDVRYLLRLKDRIMEKLVEKKLLDRFMLKNLQVQSRVFLESPQEKCTRIVGYSSLRDHEKEMFRRVFDVRQDCAQMYNIPSHQVISNRDLLTIARDFKSINRLCFSGALSVNAIKNLMRELKETVATPEHANRCLAP